MDFNNIDTGGGTEFWLRDICAFLSPRHKISVLTTNRSARNADIKKELVEVYGTSVEEIVVANPSSVPVPSGWKRLRDVFAESDVVYSIFSPGGLDFAELILHRVTSVPLILGHHQPVAWSGFEGSLSASRRVYYALFGFRGIRVAQRVRLHHVINHESKEDLERLGVKSVALIPYGIDTSRFSPRPKFDKFTICYVGRLTSQKGTDFLPSLLARLTARIANFELIIAGAGEQETIVREMVKNPRVRWIGFADDRTKAELFARSHVLILPSRYEALGLVGLESLASGTPVVSFDIPGPREYVINGSNGFLARDIDEMTERIVTVERSRSDGVSYSGFADRSRESAKKFDWSYVGPRFEKMLVDASTQG